MSIEARVKKRERSLAPLGMTMCVAATQGVRRKKNQPERSEGSLRLLVGCAP